MQIMKRSPLVSIPTLSGHTLRATSGARRHVAALLSGLLSQIEFGPLLQNARLGTWEPGLSLGLRQGVTRPIREFKQRRLTMYQNRITYFLMRESPRSYQNKVIHAWIAHWIYGDVPLYSLFRMQLLFGLAAFVLQLSFSIHKDIGRIKQLRYGRRLKGPVLVNAKDFTAAVSGNGIGIKTNDFKLPLRIPRDAENKHFLIVGDTGSGKSSIIRQMLYQVDARGDSAIVYDPACEFVKQFYDECRGDIVLNPLDARMPYWNPSKELRRKAEAKALAVLLYQPEGVTNRFFVEAPQKIFAHLLSYRQCGLSVYHTAAGRFFAEADQYSRQRSL
jgi:hypothetical protein